MVHVGCAGNPNAWPRVPLATWTVTVCNMVAEPLLPKRHVASRQELVVGACRNLRWSCGLPREPRHCARVTSDVPSGVVNVGVFWVGVVTDRVRLEVGGTTKRILLETLGGAERVALETLGVTAGGVLETLGVTKAVMSETLRTADHQNNNKYNKARSQWRHQTAKHDNFKAWNFSSEAPTGQASGFPTQPSLHASSFGEQSHAYNGLRGLSDIQNPLGRDGNSNQCLTPGCQSTINPNGSRPIQGQGNRTPTSRNSINTNSQQQPLCLRLDITSHDHC